MDLEQESAVISNENSGKEYAHPESNEIRMTSLASEWKWQRSMLQAIGSNATILDY